LLLATDCILLFAAVSIGVGADVYDRLRPTSWRGAHATAPIVNALFIAVWSLWVVIVPLAITSWVRQRGRAR